MKRHSRLQFIPRDVPTKVLPYILIELNYCADHVQFLESFSHTVNPTADFGSLPCFDHLSYTTTPDTVVVLALYEVSSSSCRVSFRSRARAAGSFRAKPFHFDFTSCGSKVARNLCLCLCRYWLVLILPSCSKLCMMRYTLVRHP